MTNHEILGHLAAVWKNRREGLMLKKGTVKEREGQLHFVIGAVKTLEMVGQVNAGLSFVVMLISTGRDLVDEYIQYAPAETPT